MFIRRFILLRQRLRLYASAHTLSHLSSQFYLPTNTQSIQRQWKISNICKYRLNINRHNRFRLYTEHTAHTHTHMLTHSSFSWTSFTCWCENLLDNIHADSNSKFIYVRYGYSHKHIHFHSVLLKLPMPNVISFKIGAFFSLMFCSIFDTSWATILIITAPSLVSLSPLPQPPSSLSSFFLSIF